MDDDCDSDSLDDDLDGDGSVNAVDCNDNDCIYPGAARRPYVDTRTAMIG